MVLVYWPNTFFRRFTLIICVLPLLLLCIFVGGYNGAKEEILDVVRTFKPVWIGKIRRKNV